MEISKLKLLSTIANNKDQMKGLDQITFDFKKGIAMSRDSFRAVKVAIEADGVMTLGKGVITVNSLGVTTMVKQSSVQNFVKFTLYSGKDLILDTGKGARVIADSVSSVNSVKEKMFKNKYAHTVNCAPNVDDIAAVVGLGGSVIKFDHMKEMATFIKEMKIISRAIVHSNQPGEDIKITLKCGSRTIAEFVIAPKRIAGDVNPDGESL